MPGAVATWVLGWASAGAGLGVAASYALAGLAYVGTALAASYALGAVASSLMGRPRVGALRSRDIVVKTSTGPRPIIYGEVTVGGTLVYIGTTGSTNQYLDFVVALAGHQITSITDVWFDDVKIVAADINGGNAAGGAVGGSGQFKPHDGTTVAYIYKFVGTDAQTASSVLSSSSGDGYNPGKDSSGADLYEWTADHRLRGVAYVHIRLRRRAKTYESGPPQTFKFRVKGAKVYDPRLDSTNGGSGTHRYTDATTWAWSNNPALCVADYITGGTIVNDVATPVRRRGFGAAATDVDWASVIAAANICDEDVTIPPASPATTQNRYECDGVLTPSDDFPDADCLEALLTSMLGQVVFTNGEYRVYAGAYETPVYTLTEADLAGTLSNTTGAGRDVRYNTVRGTRYDQDSGLEVEFLSRTDASYVTEDGHTLYHDIELPFTVNEYRAQRIAQVILRRSREQEMLTWPGQLSCAKIAIWETAAVTVAELGLASKVFRAVGRKMRAADGPPTELVLREENSSTYTDPLVADYDSPTVSTPATTAGGQLDEPTGLTATSLAGGIEFVIAPAAGASTDEVYEIYEHTASTPFSSATLIWSGRVTKVVVAKGDQTTRYYWVKARRNESVSTNYPATTGVSGVALPGGTGLTVSLSLSAINIPCDAGGVPISGAFTNAVGQVTVYAGTTDVTASATYSSTTSNCTGSVNTATNTPVTGAKGSYRVTAMSAESGYLEITVTYNGVSVPIRFTVNKARAGAASSFAQDTSFGNVTVTSYPTTGQGGPIQIAVGPNGTMRVSAFGVYQASTTTGATVSVTAKIQYRAVGSGTWLDFTGASATGTNASYNTTDLVHESGEVLISETTLAGPASQALYEFQLVCLKTGTPNANWSGTPQLTAQWTP